VNSSTSSVAPVLISIVSPVIAIVVGVLIASANYAVQRWRYRLDRLSVAADHISTEVNAAADLSTEYWLLDVSQNSEFRQALAIEPKLIGRQIRLQSLMIALEALDGKVDLNPSSVLLASLFGEMTGGSFKSSGRLSDPDRAQKVQAIAAELNGVLRTAIGNRSRKLT
jgi:hypothetical protein